MANDNSIARVLKLREELHELEQDPKVKKVVAKGVELREFVSELGLNDREAAEMLVPTALATPDKPIVYLGGNTRLPVSPGKKMLLQDDLLTLRAEIDRLLKKLEADPVVQQRTELTHSIGKMELSNIDAAELLSPGISRRLTKDVTRRKGGRKTRADRFWKHPTTGEVVRARATSNNTLRGWVEEHGQAILDDWQISEAEAKDLAKTN